MQFQLEQCCLRPRFRWACREKMHNGVKQLCGVSELIAPPPVLLSPDMGEVDTDGMCSSQSSRLWTSGTSGATAADGPIPSSTSAPSLSRTAADVYVVDEIVCKRLKRCPARQRTERYLTLQAQLDQLVVAALLLADGMHTPQAHLYTYKEKDNDMFECVCSKHMQACSYEYNGVGPHVLFCTWGLLRVCPDRISWEGAPSAEDTWQSWSSIKHIWNGMSQWERRLVPLEPYQFRRLKPQHPPAHDTVTSPDM